MRWRCVCSRVAAVCLLGGLDSHLVRSAPQIGLQRDGTLAIAGRSLRCGGVRNVLDPRLPNLGFAAAGVVIFNPRLLSRHTDTVRLFVFHHECGHHHVGGSETGADCWAARQGVRQGWLDRQGLAQVCRSFGNAPATPTHPSGAARCQSLERCFAGAVDVEARRSMGRTASTAAPRQDPPAPKLISGPTLVRDAVQPALQ